jgi:hypothetical protein
VSAVRRWVARLAIVLVIGGAGIAAQPGHATADELCGHANIGQMFKSDEICVPAP